MAAAITPATSPADALTMIPLLRVQRFITLHLRRLFADSRRRDESGDRVLDHLDSAIRTADSGTESMTGERADARRGRGAQAPAAADQADGGRIRAQMSSCH
ncbi:hypothetical protein GCM10011574_26300 [Microbispora bryophytorum]|uniref:Uncharacterized protein n=1 Tax=Microbispora bryophytorum TaxID=1460882 RepID=A0A8H9H3N3_9ACTN|nr:hypothetical protein GCM10011574_26300 [Microbispora bryophytorum]